MLGLQREGQQVTDSDWDGPACQECDGKGEIVLVRGNHWMSVECVDCHGTGLADAPPPPPRVRADGYRIPENGEEYDPDVHGPLPAATGYLPWRLPAE